MERTTLTQAEKLAKAAEAVLKPMGADWHRAPAGMVDPWFERSGMILLPHFKKIMGSEGLNLLNLLADIKSDVELKSRRLLRIDYQALRENYHSVFVESVPAQEVAIVQRAVELGLIKTRFYRGNLNIGFRTIFDLTDLGYALERAWGVYLWDSVTESLGLTSSTDAKTQALDGMDAKAYREAYDKMPEVIADDFTRDVARQFGIPVPLSA